MTAEIAPERLPRVPTQAHTKLPSVRARRVERAVVVAMVLLPALGFAAGLGLLWSGRLGLHHHVAFVLLYLWSGLGITIGYHRHFTHRGFETSRAMQGLLAIAGATAVQGPVIRWVADHRRHHAFSDRPGDPHSPHLEPRNGRAARLRGLWHAHVGWLFDEQKTVVRRYAADLVSDPLLAGIDRGYVLWVVLSLAVPAALGAAFSGTAMGALGGLVWGGLARIFAVQQVTWAVNSVCHVFGSRPAETGDGSRNHRLLAVLALGEGWHNNHHARPWSAIHGVRPGEFDLSGWLIRRLEGRGLVWGVRGPG